MVILHMEIFTLCSPLGPNTHILDKLLAGKPRGKNGVSISLMTWAADVVVAAAVVAIDWWYKDREREQEFEWNLELEYNETSNLNNIEICMRAWRMWELYWKQVITNCDKIVYYYNTL